MNNWQKLFRSKDMHPPCGNMHENCSAHFFQARKHCNWDNLGQWTGNFSRITTNILAWIVDITHYAMEIYDRSSCEVHCHSCWQRQTNFTHTHMYWRKMLFTRVYWKKNKAILLICCCSKYWMVNVEKYIFRAPLSLLSPLRNNTRVVDSFFVNNSQFVRKIFKHKRRRTIFLVIFFCVFEDRRNL